MKQRLPHSSGSIRFSANISLPKRGFPRNSAIIGARNAAMKVQRIMPTGSAASVYSANISAAPAYIPPHGLTRHPEKYDAHIYTPDELERFFTAVDDSRSVPSECPYRALVMPVFFRILYTSGMRVSELRLAKIRDIDLANGYIRVLSGKNQKDRLVPIHPDLVSRCVELKDQIHSGSPENEFFFMVRPGREMTLQNLYHNFRRYLDKARILHTGRGPRIHDFRHTYCVNLLLKWSEEGKDLLAYLPYMRTMLGHESFEETAYYLKLTSAAFPFVREHLEAAFPDIIQEVAFHEHEFY